MHLSLLGISISLFGIAIILSSTSGAPSAFGLFICLCGVLVSLVACVINEFRKVKESSILK